MRNYTSILMIPFFVLFAFVSVNAHAEQMSEPTSEEYGVVINLSGRQRMLSQKMSKESLLVALGINAGENITNLAGTISLFDKTLLGLREGDSELGLPPTNNRRIVRQLKKVEAIWVDLQPVFREIVKTGEVTPDQLAVVAEKNLPLLKAMNKVVGQYEKAASKGGLKASPEIATAINLSGKQRMLTQKMSKEFLLIVYGHNVEENKLNLFETASLFDRTIVGLQSGDDALGLAGTDDSGIQSQLKVVENMWNQFKTAIFHAANESTVEIPDDLKNTVARDNVPLLKEMNKAVGMFEKQA